MAVDAVLVRTAVYAFLAKNALIVTFDDESLF